ncbi:MAG: transcriptional regulator [Rhodospirillaceae bacterium]|jgi:DNA-binding MarR family transcriptional regulator|nr:transcriptional regulator [Rhodospirillaceae bacterium]
MAENGADRQSQIDPIGYLIGDVSRMIRTVYDRRVEPLGLTRAQWRVMTRLNRLESCTQTELATALEVEKPTLGKLIERLEVKGWVDRRADPNDARSKRLYLTPAARPVLADMHKEAEDVVAGIFAGLDGEEAARLHAMLDHIKGNLSEMLDDPALTPVEA